MSVARGQLKEQTMDAIIGRKAPEEGVPKREAFGVSYAEYTDKEGPFKGIINEFDFHRLLKLANSATLSSLKEGLDQYGQHQIDQWVMRVTHIAEQKRIELIGANDPRVILYILAKNDVHPTPINGKKVSHHSEMSDQRIFEEILRMVGDTESLKKLLRPSVVEPKKRSEMTLAEKGHKSLNKYAAENLRMALEQGERRAKEDNK